MPANGDGRVTITGLDVDGYGRLVACDYDYLNGIVAHPDGTTLLVASQGEGGTLWRADLAGQRALTRHPARIQIMFLPWAQQG